MVTYFKNNKPAQFFGMGSIWLVVGMLTQRHHLFLGTASLVLALFFLGYFATKKALLASLQDRKVNVDLLMVLAALGAMLIGECVEGAILLFIFSGAEVLERYVTAKSSANLTHLLQALPEMATVVRADGQLEERLVSTIQIGEKVLVAKGEQFPLDGRTLQQTSVSEMALTGEALPANKAIGDTVFAGTINLGEAVAIEVTQTSEATVFASIIRLVQEVQNQPSKLETGIERFEAYFVPIVLVGVPLFILALIGIQGLMFQEAFYRGMVLLTVASPCALVASVTPATLSAISYAAKLGVLVKGGRVLTQLADLNQVFTDKTGTLTTGDFKVVNYRLSEQYVPIVFHMVSNSKHPISQAMAKFLNQAGTRFPKQDGQVLEVAGQGLTLGNYHLGNGLLLKGLQDPHHYLNRQMAEATTVFFADEKEILGYFALEDQVRLDALMAVEGFSEDRVNIEMLTGDREAVAKTVSHRLGIKDYQAGCLPTDKAERVKKASQTKVVAMIGDGINDAPALAQAQIGIAMGSGTALAMEVADMVMVKNNLSKLLEVYRLSKRLKRIVYQNISFALLVMLTLVVLNLLGVLDLTKGVIFHETSTILVILNGLRLLAPVEGDKAANF